MSHPAGEWHAPAPARRQPLAVRDPDASSPQPTSGQDSLFHLTELADLSDVDAASSSLFSSHSHQANNPPHPPFPTGKGPSGRIAIVLIPPLSRHSPASKPSQQMWNVSKALRPLWVVEPTRLRGRGACGVTTRQGEVSRRSAYFQPQREEHPDERQVHKTPAPAHD